MRMTPARRLAVLAAVMVACLSGASAGSALSPDALAEPPSRDAGALATLERAGIITGALNGVSRPPDVAADSWIVADADTGDILAAKRAYVPHPPASTLKVLTALALAHRLSPDEEVAAPTNVEHIDGTRVGLVPGVRYKVSDLMTAMLIASGNDAAETLAAAAGGRSATLALMRAEATRLQAFSTIPGTPSGLDAPGQQTTAYDLAVIGRAALDDATVAPYLTIPRAVLSAPGVKSVEIDSHNPLLGIYPGIVGVKAGYTTLAEATYIGASKRMGHRIIISLLFAYPRFKPAATALLDWGFAARGRVTPLARLADPLTPAQIVARAAAGKLVNGGAGSSQSGAQTVAKGAPFIATESAVKRRLLDIAGTLALACAALRFRVRLRRARQSASAARRLNLRF